MLKRTVSTFAKLFALVAILACAGSVQGIQSRELTKNEKNEAIRVAKLFEERINTGMDVSPLLDEFFVRDFLKRYLKDPGNYTIPYLRYDFTRTLPETEFRRYYVSLVNFEYLTKVYFLSRFSLEENTEDVTFEESYPTGVAELVKKIYPQDINEFGSTSEPVLANKMQLLEFVDVQEQATSLIRNYFKSHPLNPGAGLLRKNAQWLDSNSPSGELYKPSAKFCRDKCYGFPAGTKLVTINIVVYQLLLVHVDGELKIINLAAD